MASVTNRQVGHYAFGLMCGLLLFSTAIAQQFSDATFSVDYPGMSVACMSALNTTLQCSSILASVSLYNEHLSPNDLTLLCTAECSQSLSDVRTTIKQACVADTDVIVDGGIAYPATWVLDHFSYTFNISCLEDPSTHQYCDTLIQSWSNGTMTHEQACSECVLRSFQIEVESPLDYSIDDAQAFASMTSSCSATGYTITQPSPYALNGTAAANSTTTGIWNTTSTTIVSPRPTCSSGYVVKDGDDCNSVALAQNVSTFGLTYTNGLDAYCFGFPSAGAELCLPAPCEVYTVQPGDTCLSVVQKQTRDITVTQLQTWNPNLNRLCSNMDRLSNTVICVSPPGGFLQVGPNAAATTTIAATAASPPANVESGTNPRCGKYYTVRKGDYCSLVTVQFGISLADFYFLNPELDRTNCLNLILGQAYCVQAVGSISTYPGYSGGSTNICAGPSAPASCFGDVATLTDAPYIPPNATWSFSNFTATSTSSAAAQTSLPHAPDTIDGCYKYANYQPDNATDSSNSINNCTLVAALYHVAVSDLIAWNPSLDLEPNCALQPGYSYCVQKSASDGANAPVTFDTCAPATSTMDGTSAACTCYTTIHGYDMEDYGCDLLTADYGISVAKLTSLNSWIGDGDCTAGLYADLGDNDSRDVCVGDSVSSTAASTNVVVSTTTHVAITSTVSAPVISGLPPSTTTSAPVTTSPTSSMPAVSISSTISEIPTSPLTSSMSDVLISSTIIAPSISEIAASTSNNEISTPVSSSAAPTATGTTPECQEYYTVQSGDSCDAIEQAHNITFEQFLAWNPSIGSNCENLWVGFAYCVAGPAAAPRLSK